MEILSATCSIIIDDEVYQTIPGGVIPCIQWICRSRSMLHIMASIFVLVDSDSHGGQMRIEDGGGFSRHVDDQKFVYGFTSAEVSRTRLPLVNEPVLGNHYSLSSSSTSRAHFTSRQPFDTLFSCPSSVSVQIALSPIYELSQPHGPMAQFPRLGLHQHIGGTHQAHQPRH